MNRFRLYAGIFAFFSILDLTFTGVLSLNPMFEETNPIANLIFKSWGFLGMAIYKVILMAFAYLVALVIRKESNLIATRLMATASVIVGAVVSYSFVLLSIVLYHEVILVKLGY